MSAVAVGAAVVGAAGSAYAANEQSSAAGKAAGMSEKAAIRAEDLQRQQYFETKQMQAPWQKTGATSLNKLSSLLGTNPQYAVDKEMFRTGTKKNLVDVSADNFNEQGYLDANQDIIAAGWDAGGLKHFQRFGMGEGRKQYVYDPQYDEAAYQQAVKDAEAKAAQDPEYGSLLKSFSMADYEADPGYAFRLAEGQKGLERSAAARGGLYSGRAMKDMDAYSQGQASQEYGNAYNRFNTNQTNKFNRLATLAGYGQTANNQVQQAGSQFANNTGNILTENATNQGNAQLAAANAQASSYSGIGKALGGVNWGSLGGTGSGYTPTSAQQGAADFTNGWNSSNYG